MKNSKDAPSIRTNITDVLNIIIVIDVYIL